jgi:hypothetical protein
MHDFNSERCQMLAMLIKLNGQQELNKKGKRVRLTYFERRNIAPGAMLRPPKEAGRIRP